MHRSETRKKVTSLKSILLCLITSVMLSCVSEDELNLPDDESTFELTHSVAIVSALRAVESESLIEDDCFQFQFPLQLGFNNDLTVSISDFSGLKEVSENAVSSQHINSVQFPITVIKNSITKTIENEGDFIELLEDCHQLTLRDEFDKVFTQCFDFVYPIQMLDLSNNEVTIESKTSYFEFEADQGFDKQPNFVYPITLFDYASENSINIENPFSLFETFDTCGQCPELSFEIDTLLPNRFSFIADFERKNEISYGWYINDEKVEEDGGAVQGDNKLTQTLAPGEYTICIRTSLPDEDCFSGAEFCKEIIVHDSCPLLSFETQARDNFTYEFIANFELKNDIEYWWSIYQNEEIIFSAPSSEIIDNKLVYEFSEGDYVVCLETETPDCPQGTNFCASISIP